MTLRRSLDLRQSSIEIPMARADILQANLPTNPIFYQDGQLLQYKGQPFNRARPGGPQQFDTNVTYPLDISHKRQARTAVATRAEKVLEAQYQEAVRQRIDDVYDAFVTALAARQTAPVCGHERQGAGDLAGPDRAALQRGSDAAIDSSGSRTSSARPSSRRVDAEAVLSQGQARPGLAHEPRPSRRVPRLKISGKILVAAPAAAALRRATEIALAERPDVASFRLGIQRANADVRLARANAYSDVYVSGSPIPSRTTVPTA